MGWGSGMKGGLSGCESGDIQFHTAIYKWINLSREPWICVPTFHIEHLVCTIYNYCYLSYIHYCNLS